MSEVWENSRQPSEASATQAVRVEGSDVGEGKTEKDGRGVTKHGK